MNRKIAIICALAAALAACAVCCAAFGGWDGGHDGGDGDGGAEHVVDAAGRSVPVPESIESIVTVDKCGPLRFLSIFDRDDFHPMSMVVECDETDRDGETGGRGFLYAFPVSKDVGIHADSALPAETAESIAGRHPSLVIITENVYDKYSEETEVLASACPVLVIPEQDMEHFFHFDETGKTLKLDRWYVETVTMLGKALRQEDRAAEHISEVEGLLNDVRRYVGTTDKTSYVVGVAYSGTHEWDTTFPTYIPLELAGGRNAYDGPGGKTNVKIDVERAVEDYISKADAVLVDPTSSSKMGTVNTQVVMQKIYELNNDSDPGNDIRLFSVVSVVWCSMNYDSAIACAYQLCHILYGTLDGQGMRDKIDNVFETFYGEAGKGVREGMTAFFEQKAEGTGMELPMLSELEIVKTTLNGEDFYITAPLAQERPHGGESQGARRLER